MCWHHDIESQMKESAGRTAPRDAGPASASAPPRLTDIALLVGNLYAAGSSEESLPGVRAENSGC